ncbi:t-SNARE [Mortierella sp. GBAus27b]|nr:t-SNARE [Mortierella sp. GBAus27b]
MTLRARSRGAIVIQEPLSSLHFRTEVIQSKIQQFQNNITEIDQLSEKSLNSREGEATKLLDEKIRVTNNLSTEIYDRLRALTASNMKVRTKEEYDQHKLRTSTLSKQFKDAVSRFQNVQHQHGIKSKENMARQFRIAKPDATEEEIRQMVEQDQGSVFSQQLLQQARSQQAVAALNSVQDRQRELARLQENVVELAQLYKQLEQLMMEQDLTFQQIEESVKRTEVDLESGLGQTHQALQDATSARKKKWMTLGLSVIIIILIIIIVGVTQGWFKKST